MEMFVSVLLLIVGLALLYYGAEWLVAGSSEIALRLGISPLVVGLTVVAFGTSAPELLVSVNANRAGQPDMALGNVIGSNICNIALILGVGALIKPITIKLQIIRREMPILIVSSLIFAAMLWDGVLQRWEGFILAAMIVIYVVASIYFARHEPESSDTEDIDELAEAVKHAGEKGRLKRNVIFIVMGLVALVFGANLLVENGQKIAIVLGVPASVIALTMIAFGTSLPELATSVVASIRNQGDLITGNAIGSCIFNLLAVVGITGSISAIKAHEINWTDMATMVGVSVLILPFMVTRRHLSRVEGAILLAGYLGYCIYVVQR